MNSKANRKISAPSRFPTIFQQRRQVHRQASAANDVAPKRRNVSHQQTCSELLSVMSDSLSYLNLHGIRKLNCFKARYYFCLKSSYTEIISNGFYILIQKEKNRI